MLKGILGVVVGYITTVAVVFITFTVLWMVLGASGAFEPGSWDTSMTWCIATLVLGLIAAIAGGWVCAVIARSIKAVIALVVLTVLLGLLSAVAMTAAPEGDAASSVRAEDDIAMFDAMTNAKQPSWVAFLNPLVGAVGIMLGAKLVGRKGDGAVSAP